jgi:hypothetical protein
MPKFITTSETSFLIEQLITESAKFLIIISPYINLHERLKILIKQKEIDKDYKVLIIYGKKTDQADVVELKKLKYVTVEYVDNLHAKCYFNEFNMILTSMNLYEYSQINNIEFGFLINAVNEYSYYSTIVKELDTLPLSPESLLRIKLWLKYVERQIHGL